mmetsp:Transcript_11631/g.10293  ORF Transcript_11631/g.10293 Transcript_11631/m.10293 type:complete len:143 (+) Transcript_11631:39-467(+)
MVLGFGIFRKVMKVLRVVSVMRFVVMMVGFVAYADGVRDFYPNRLQLDFMNHKIMNRNARPQLNLNSNSDYHILIKDSHLLVLTSAMISIILLIYVMLKCVETSNYARIELKKTRKQHRIRKANLINEKLHVLGVVGNQEED